MEKTEQPPKPEMNKALIITAVAVLLLLAALDQTIVATALPTIVSDLGGLDHLSWVVTAYLLTATVVAPLYGKLGDLFGRKLMMQISVSLFLFGSILAGLSQNMTFLIFSRAVQGLGGGGLFVLALTVVGDVIPPRERGKIQGIFGGVFGLSSVAGPLLGGFFVDNLSWRWIFYINLPIGIAALAVFAIAFKAQGNRQRHKIDYLGAALLTVSLSSIVLLTSLGGRSYGWQSGFIIFLMALAVTAAVLFFLVEMRAQEPILPLGLFRYNNFWVMCGVTFGIGAAMFGAITFLPLYLQMVKGVSPTGSGLQMVPLTLGILVGSMGSGQIMSRTGHYRFLPMIGAGVLILGLIWMTTLAPDTSTLTIMAMMLVVGFGLGPSMSVGMTSIQNAIPREMLGAGTAGFTMFRQIGGSFGVSLSGALFSNNIVNELGSFMPNGASANQLNSQMLGQLPPEIQSKVLLGITNAIHPVFILGAGAACLALLFSFLLKEIPLRKRN